MAWRWAILSWRCAARWGKAPRPPRRAQVRCEKRCPGRGQGVCGGTGRLNRARRRLVVLELVIDLQPVALGVGDDEPTVVVIEDHRRGE
jgi:hypothetical protein